MNTSRSISNRYRQILIASVLSSGTLLSLNPALADQNTAAGGSTISNQATAEFTDAADPTNTAIPIVSDTVSVTVAEIAAITVSTPTISGTQYRSGKSFVDFKVYNSGNDPTKLFIPAKPSSATMGTANTNIITSVDQLEVIGYTTVTTDPTTGVTTESFTSITTNNKVDTTLGSSTADLTGVTAAVAGGSIPAGSYITVRVPVNIPQTAVTNDVITIKLGNAPLTTGVTQDRITTIAANNVNDLYTVDNTGTSLPAGEVTSTPFNGEQETSRSGSITVINPTLTISGRVWDDVNSSGTLTDFTGIQDGSEVGANPLVISPIKPLQAVLIDSSNKVIAFTNVTTGSTATENGKYTFTGVVGYQTGVYVVLTTTTVAVGDSLPANGLPANWVPTTALTYSGSAFPLTSVNVAGKDFGIQQLPTALGGSITVTNPTGTIAYSVPTTLFTGSSDPGLGGTVTSYLITAFPNGVDTITLNGTTYYPTGTTPPAGGVAFPATGGVTVLATNLSTITVDPVDGGVTVLIPFKAIDNTNEVSTNPSNASITFTAANVSVAGNVWDDRNNSGATTTIRDGSPLESGTNAVFGTNTTAVQAVLVDMTTPASPIVLQSTTVNATTGAYSFTGVAPSKNVTVLLLPSTTTVANGSAILTSSAALPTSWVKTSAITLTTFNTGLVPVAGKDFGIRQKAKLVLAKRITKIAGATTNPNDTAKVLTTRTGDTFNFTAPYAGNWPATTLIGLTDGGLVKPGDEIEYTIYFLNNQGADAKNIKICDRIRGSQTYVAGSLSMEIGGVAVAVSDGANTYGIAGSSTASTPAPSACNFNGSTISTTTTDNGGVWIAPGVVPGATGVGTPTGSYGSFKFRTKVKEQYLDRSRGD